MPVLATEVAPSSEPYQRARGRMESLLAEVQALQDKVVQGGSHASVQRHRGRGKLPGTVQSVHVSEGQPVSAGDRLVIVEAMKMEHVIRATGDAVETRVLVETGESVPAGRVLVELEDRP